MCVNVVGSLEPGATERQRASGEPVAGGGKVAQQGTSADATRRRLAPGVLSLVCAMFCGYAFALPDLARGLAALDRGDLSAAESDLLPLAEKGYADAQVALGRLYARQDSIESAKKAVHWFRVVEKRDPAMRVPLARALLAAGSFADPAEIDRMLDGAISANDPAALALRMRLYRTYPRFASVERSAALAAKVAGSRDVEHRAEAITWYREHATVKENAVALAVLCEKDRMRVEACYADLARYYRGLGDASALTKLRAEAAERHARKLLSGETLERIARVLSADDLPGPSQPREAYALLASVGQLSPEGLARKARLLLADPSLDPAADPRKMLQTAYAQGSVEAALQLGRLFMDPRDPQVDPDRAERLLGEAALRLPAGHFYLGRLLERGYRGKVNAQRAQRHYLLAARAGYPRGDLALARLYWNNRGARVDEVKAYAFAWLAELGAVPGASEQVQELKAALGPDDIRAGQQLADQELVARRAVATRTVQTSLTTAEIHQP